MGSERVRLEEMWRRVGDAAGRKEDYGGVGVGSPGCWTEDRRLSVRLLVADVVVSEGQVTAHVLEAWMKRRGYHVHRRNCVAVGPGKCRCGVWKRCVSGGCGCDAGEVELTGPVGMNGGALAADGLKCIEGGTMLGVAEDGARIGTPGVKEGAAALKRGREEGGPWECCIA